MTKKSGLREAPSRLEELCINTLRFLAVDAIQQANSGHPGLPLGAAAMAFTLWDRFLKFNPKDPHWPDRDRFVLSAGHGSMLLYALLHLTGYALPLDEIKRFRQLGSMTPGHPEYGLPGVEATTGPLGQGFGNAVGMAIAECALAARFNRPGHTLVDHYTYLLAGDGDLMEGVTAEAASLAGHLKLGKLIVLYDDNRISIEGSTDLAFSEDRGARFAAYGWQVLKVADGNDVAALAGTLAAAQSEPERPSLIAVRTVIGYGSPHKEGTAAAHGEPLGEEEVRLTKERLGWPLEPPFCIPAAALEHFRRAVPRGAARQADWEARFRAYAQAYPELAAEFTRVMAGRLPSGWEAALPAFAADRGPLATRAAGGLVLNAIASQLPELMGGAADLAPSTKTLIKGGGSFQAGDRGGRNLHFGVREHAMGAIVNGLALHGGILPFGATFLIFSDYMRPPLRMAAMGGLKAIYIFTHDSLGVGEDGPTHQPVEQLLSLRAIPNFLLLRPADANETAAAWRLAVTHAGGPVALALSRQKLPILDPARFPQVAEGVSRGGYILTEAPAGGAPDLILIATGAEVHLALEAHEKLAGEGIRARVVSLPGGSRFLTQSVAYREAVLPAGVPRLVLEAGVSLGWRSYLDNGPDIEVIGVDRFGVSGPGKAVMQEFGFNLENVCRRARMLLAKEK